ncbi:TPA: hypothetical protein ACH3X3_001437 [Trebouxia sp. C0006]
MQAKGRVVNKRPLSRRLVFLELERDKEHDLELLLKASTDPEGLSDSQVHSLRDIVKVGDVILATGTLEPGTNTLRVSSIDIIEAWKTNHVGICFVPKLLPSLHPELVHTVPSGHNMHTDGSYTTVPPNTKHCPELRGSPRILCKYWVNAGKCLRGDACQYRHVQPAQLPELRKGWVAARRRHKQELSSEAGNPHGFDAAKKCQRASVFCDWLIATFGSEVLSQGSGVLDIAGGRGDVSFELQTVRGIRCTLIDPRPQKLSKSQRKWLQHFKQQPCVAAGTEVNSDTAPVNCSDAETPAAGQGNISPASVCSSPGESATEDPPNHAADQRHLPSYAAALPPIHPPASDDNVTAGDAGAHATCSDLQDQAIKHTPVDICSAQPASIEAALTDPQPHPANPQPATADAVMSFSRSGSAAAEVASLTHGPHGDEGHTSAHGGGVQNSSEDLRGSLSQQIQVTAGYQSVHHCKLKSQRS